MPARRFFAAAMAVLTALKAVNLVRVSLEGLDIDQHGISAYPDDQIAPWAWPGPKPARQ